MIKYPTCECNQQRYDYFRKRYRNGTLHLMRQCPQCGAIAQNPMKQAEYDRAWVDGLPVIENGAKPTIQSRAEAIQTKLQNHIENRTHTAAV